MRPVFQPRPHIIPQLSESFNQTAAKASITQRRKLGRSKFYSDIPKSYASVAGLWGTAEFGVHAGNVKFIHSVFCLTTGPKPPPKRCLHIVRSRASSFK